MKVLSTLIITILLMSMIICDPQEWSNQLDFENSQGNNGIPVTDFISLVDPTSGETLRKVATTTTNPNPSYYKFKNENFPDDGRIFHFVTVNIAVVYFANFVDLGLVDFNLKLSHNGDVDKQWSKSTFSFQDVDYSNNGMNRPTHTKRTYLATFTVELPTFAAGKLTVEFSNMNTSQQFYFQNFRAYFSKCKPDCSDCSYLPYKCNACTSGYALNNDGQCNCNVNGYVALPNNQYYYNAFYLRCHYLQTSPGTEYDLCQTYENYYTLEPADPSARLNYCKTCAANSFWKYSSLTIGPTCICQPNYVPTNLGNNMRMCKSPIDQECTNYVLNQNDISTTIDFLKQTTLNLNILSKKDDFTGENYYNLELVVQSLAPYYNYNQKLAFLIFINAPVYPGGIIQNTLYSNYWLNQRFPSINLNIGSLANLADCTTVKNLDNGSRLWKCLVSLIAFHPCKNYIYMNTKIPIEIGEGGIVKSNYQINTESSNLLVTIPCIRNNSCFINKDYSSTLFLCDDQQCKNPRTTSYKIGETIWLRSSLTVANGGNPASFRQLVESASFDLYDNMANFMTSFDLQGNYVLGTDFANQQVFGFPVQITSDMLSNSSLVTGRLVLNVYFRVNPVRLRILEEAKRKEQYPVTPPIQVTINIDETSIPGYEKKENNAQINNVNGTDGKGNNEYLIAIIVVSVVLALIIIAVVIYFIKRKNSKGNNEVPVTDPAYREKTEAKYESVPPISMGTNYEHSDQRKVESNNNRL